MNEIIIAPGGHLLLPIGSKQNTRDRIQPYLNWLDQSGVDWKHPDLAAYRDYLRERLSERSIGAHLATIRGSYNRLLKSNTLRDEIMLSLPDERTLVERIILTNEWITRIENAINPQNAPLDIVTRQDHEPHVRLTKVQVSALLRLPDVKTLVGLRDVAIIRLMLATGIREQEAVDLEVRDLYQHYYENEALEVRSGKGRKQRKVPYGEMHDWCIPYVERWLTEAKITSGSVFVGLWKDDSLRSRKFHRTTIGSLLVKYPIKHLGQPYTVTPHDLRYTYARRCYDEGMTVEAISRNMGHSQQETTLRYIGDLDAKRRAPKRVYD